MIIDSVTNVRFTMLADIIRPSDAPIDISTSTSGQWQTVQDDESGAIERIWVPIVDDPTTEIIEQNESFYCMARGVETKGIRSQGNSQAFSEMYRNIDYIHINFSETVILTKNDKVTNIRDANTGEIIWKEYEIDGYPATLFDVQGITPIIDPFGVVQEKIALLMRASVQ